jgi:hypothetical protein
MGHKVYVPVTAGFDADGNITPIDITWIDGHVYAIDRILDIRRAVSQKGGGLGIRYTCRIGGNTANIWRDDTRWFVESKEAVT